MKRTHFLKNVLGFLRNGDIVSSILVDNWLDAQALKTHIKM